MKAIAFLLIFTFTGLIPDSDKIIWDENRPLKWSDFKGQVFENTPHKAATNSGIKYAYGYSILGTKRSISFEITAYMSPEKSWSKEDGQDDALLRHEQLHFDISELHARKLRRAMSKYKFTDDFEAEIKHIYKTIIMASRDMQDRYDQETDHSREEEIQVNWEEKIARGLERMKDWAGHKVENGVLGE